MDAVSAAGISRVVAGSLDPVPEHGGGLERLRAAGVAPELIDSFEARRQNEAWRTWAARAVLSSRTRSRSPSTAGSRCPGSRWISGEESRRLVHELRAASDAVAVGMGTVRADDPRSTRAAWRAAPAAAARFWQGPLPAGFRARAPYGRARGRAGRLGEDGVQSLLLEGGPTLATAFLEAGLVDKLLVFLAPIVVGGRPRFLGDLSRPSRFTASTCAVGEDILLPPMSMSPEDRAIDLITNWLTGQIEDDTLRAGLSPDGLTGEGADVVEELLAELDKPGVSRGHLQMVGREAVEALALG